MKKVYCNNLLAKVLLAFSSCHTITIGPFVLSKRPEEKITQKVRNHECTHTPVNGLRWQLPSVQLSGSCCCVLTFPPGGWYWPGWHSISGMVWSGWSGRYG